MTLATNDRTGVLKISGTLDIDEADALREALLTAFRLQAEIALDLSEVDACDTAALQVLLAGQRNAASAGKTFRMVAVSDSVTGTAAALGLSIEASNKENPYAA